MRELTRVEQTDYLDPLLQAALVLCLMGSLALCALQSGASSDRTTPYPQARPALAATCHLPAAAAPGRVLSAIRF